MLHDLMIVIIYEVILADLRICKLQDRMLLEMRGRQHVKPLKFKIQVLVTSKCLQASLHRGPEDFHNTKRSLLIHTTRHACIQFRNYTALCASVSSYNVWAKVGQASDTKNRSGWRTFLPLKSSPVTLHFFTASICLKVAGAPSDCSMIKMLYQKQCH